MIRERCITTCPRPKLLPVALGQKIRRPLMDNQTQDTKVYFHYNHTAPSKYARWTARDCYVFMYARPWQEAVDFYSNLVNGCVSLSSLFGTEAGQLQKTFSSDNFCSDDGELVEDFHKVEPENVLAENRSGRWARATFKIILSYHGNSFDGWQKQPGLNTVQGIVERSLGRFVDEKKAQQLKAKSLPLEGCAVVAGRTDKGVTALHQVCSFYTWRKDVKAQDIEDAVNNAAPGKLRVVSISEVSRVFHPNFSAKWRRYFYIFPLNDGEEGEHSFEIDENYNDQRDKYTERRDQVLVKNVEGLATNDVDEQERGLNKLRRFSISKVNQLLHQLEGKLLSYKMFARDTKASRNFGPATECFIYHARAVEARLPSSLKNVPRTGAKVMCVELVANRFLRRMIRVLVATSIREAAAGAEDDSLLKLMDATCRRATAPPAPPDGLCLFDVGYTQFDPQNCLIR